MLIKFLEKVADFLLESVGSETLHTAVIFPNKRSEIFLKNHIKNKITSGYWPPEFFTIDEFMVQASGLAEPDPVNIYFELYKIHKTIAGSESRSLDDFLAWAPVMLADFTDIDLYLADAKAVFSNLSEARAIEQWNLTGQPLTDLQKNYLTFYNSLFQYYEQLKTQLLSQGSGYKGMIYRHLCEQIETISKKWKWKQFELVGFNALSKSEKKVFGYLIKNFKVDVLFDADDYFLDDGKKTKHEAGRFIQELVDEWGLKDIKWSNDSVIGKTEKEIKVLGVPKRIGQVKYAAQLLEEWIKSENDHSVPDVFSLTDTALVLADEKLLIPFLNSLPQVVDKHGNKVPFNITMGYPLTNSAIGTFALNWISLLQSAENNPAKTLSVKHLLDLLNNPFFRFIADQFAKNDLQELISGLFKMNASFLSRDVILELLIKEDEELINLFRLVLNPSAGSKGFTDQFIEFLSRSKSAFEKAPLYNKLLKEQLVIIMSLAKKLQVLLDEIKSELNFRALEKIFTQLLSRNEINLKGEPLSGIQVMGMLETRNLDFKNLVILSVNDGILPRTENMESFIPFDIRHNFNLPLPGDKSDVYAYHFFRLLKRAEKIHLVYNSEPDAMGGGEKSRYLLQLEKEVMKGKIENARILIPVGEIPQKQVISIEKTGEVMQLLKINLEKSLSPTALTTYINCPLKFYFKKVIGLKQPESLESDIEANVMGKVIHGVLEDLFKPFEEKVIDLNKLQIPDKKIRRLILEKFKEEFPGGSLDAGKNLLIVEVAVEYLRKYLKSEKTELTKQNRIILSTEEKLAKIIRFNNFDINLNGIVDRADQVVGNDDLRIVDYKTGKVEFNDLKLKEWHDLISDPNKAKAFQVLCYTYLYLKNKKLTVSEISAGIISMRKISNGFIPLQLPNKEPVAQSLDKFEQLLFELIGQIVDPAKPFNQTDDEDRCKYCDFKDICNRNPKNDF